MISTTTPPHATDDDWWRSAVVYQVYVRSFADSDGDGVGDLQGIRQRLPYLRDLGVDALWLTPFYTSPMIDGGYDVADYRDVDPMFGTLADFDAMITDAHALGLRIIVDLVPNHTSSAHRWFTAALAAGPGSPERARYLFADGQGAHGELPPNDWESIFGGPAWTRIADGQWYLHLFDPAQPDLNWRHPEVRAEFEDVLRFWLDRGVDGFRDRRGARHDQGGRAAGRRLQHDDHRPAPGRTARQGPAALLRPGRGARDLPRLAAHPGQLPRRSDGGRRGVGRDPAAAGPLHRPGRAAPGVQLRLPRRHLVGRLVPQGDRHRAWPSRRSSARRPPGCCPTTTSSGTSPATATASKGCAGPAPPAC